MQEKFKVTPDLYASQGQRLANLFVDIIVFYLLLVILSAVLGIVLGLLGGMELVNSVVNSSAFNLYAYGIYLLYFIIFEYFLQKTVGKYLSKTRVVNIHGEKPKLSQIIGRSFARFIPFDAFSYLGSTGRGWHDTLPELYVVDENLFKQKKANFYDFKQLGKKEDVLQNEDSQDDLEVEF